jgi:hypothetical protein
LGPWSGTISKVNSMTNYTPSPDFVDRVMHEVRACQHRQKAQPPLVFRLLESRPFRWFLSCSATLIGAWNVARIYLALFAPAVCR